MGTLSIVIPAYKEEGSVVSAILRAIAERLDEELMRFEIVVVDDHSSDRTAAVVAEEGGRWPAIRCAFKCFRREVIRGIQPILSHHFNITVELPLKAMVRGYSWTVIPTNWYNRKDGVSKFKVKEMGSRYLFIVLYALIEKWLSRGDYRRNEVPKLPVVTEHATP